MGLFGKKIKKNIDFEYFNEDSIAVFNKNSKLIEVKYKESRDEFAGCPECINSAYRKLQMNCTKAVWEAICKATVLDNDEYNTLVAGLPGIDSYDEMLEFQKKATYAINGNEKHIADINYQVIKEMDWILSEDGIDISSYPYGTYTTENLDFIVNGVSVRNHTASVSNHSLDLFGISMDGNDKVYKFSIPLKGIDYSFQQYGKLTYGIVAPDDDTKIEIKFSTSTKYFKYLLEKFIASSEK